MKIDVVEMFTSEIAVVEINTLRDEMTLIIPRDFTVSTSTYDGSTVVRLIRGESA
jgi:hypothetical protein